MTGLRKEKNLQFSTSFWHNSSPSQNSIYAYPIKHFKDSDVMSRTDRTVGFGFGNMIYRYKELITVVIVLLLGYHYFIGIPHPSTLKVIMQGCQPDIWEDLNFDQDNLQSFEPDDPRFIKYIRYRYLLPPSTKEYNFKRVFQGKEYKFATQHSNWIRKYLKDKKNGIFIEAGANEGEVESHTLELETELGWTGILIECNPTVVPYLKSKHRKSWVAGVCLSTNEKFAVFNFSNPESWTYSGRVGDAWNLPVKTNWTYFDVESVPLYSIIAASGYTEIDYLSLDVEGLELKILKTFPFHEVTIKIIIAEIMFLKEEERNELIKILENNGYTLVEKLSIDWIFVHESLVV